MRRSVYITSIILMVAGGLIVAGPGLASGAEVAWGYWFEIGFCIFFLGWVIQLALWNGKSK